MNTFILAGLAEVDDRIQKLYTEFAEIKKCVPSDTYDKHFAQWEGFLRCRVEIPKPQCKCEAACGRTVGVWDVVDRCTAIVDNYYENEDIWVEPDSDDD
jgi:hypothetical protein